MNDGRKLYRSIVGYGFALAATVEAGAACSSGTRQGPMREGPTPAYCEVNDCALHGTVVDEHGKPFAGATIEYAGQTTTSDASGAWTFPANRSGMMPAENARAITARTKDGRVVTQEYDGGDNHMYGPPPVRLQFPALPPPPPPPPAP